MQKVGASSFGAKHFQVDTSEFCSEMGYFLIYPYSFDRRQKVEAEKIDPFVVTFRQDSITFEQILERYLRLNPSEKRNGKMLTFTLPGGAFINRGLSVKNLKKQLRRDSLDGLNLYVIDLPEQKRKKLENSEFDNECALMDFVAEAEFDREKQFLFHFLLPNSRYILTITINPNKKVSQLIQKFVDQLSKDYRQTVGQNQFAKIDGKAIKDYILMDGKTKYQSIPNKNQILIHQCRHFDNGDMINVIMHDKNFTFAKIIHTDFPITLIVKQDNPNIKSKIMTIRYDEITDFTVENLFWVHFLSEEDRRTFAVETRQNRICLKVLEYILKPDDTLKTINNAIQKVKTLGDFKLVAYFVTEKMIFYQHLTKLAENRDFQFEHLKLAQTQRNRQIRKKCQFDSQKYLTQRVKELQNLTTQKHFKTPKEVLPIVVYSSQLEVINDETKSNESVYASLNKWLREKSILKVKLEELQHWCYKFASVLFKHLSKIKVQNNKLYRGVTYLLEAKQKDKVTFKNFLSTSADLNVALRFAVQGQYRKKQKYPNNPLDPLVLYNITASSGKSIEHFSVYPYEKEYLYEPYSEFKIVKIKEQVFQVLSPQTGQKQKYTFTVYDLQEIVTPKFMPQTINNYIVWVDDKPYEGTLIYNQLISEFHYPTVLFQIPSTKDLAAWIKERSMIINDSSKKMIVISNMVRREDGKLNYYAGVDAINLVNSAIIPNIPIALYVGSLQSAENNMKEKGCSPSNVKMMNTYNELSEYVSQQIGVKFKRNNEENVQQLPPIANNGNSGNQNSICQIM